MKATVMSAKKMKHMSTEELEAIEQQSLCEYREIKSRGLSLSQ